MLLIHGREEKEHGIFCGAETSSSCWVSTETKMEKKCLRPEKVVINLKQLPPIDPFRIMNSSSQNWKDKSKTRASPEVVKLCPEQETNLDEFDDAPRETNATSIKGTPNSRTVDKTSTILSIENSDTSDNITSQMDPSHRGIKKGSARSNLYEICAENHWNTPTFECCKEEGPSHQRMFTFKVLIEIEAESKTIMECFGAPCPTKKTAADHAAEGALWYLKHEGYVTKKQYME